LSDYPIHDSLFSVTRLQTRSMINTDTPLTMIRYFAADQNLPPVYEENSCIYIFTRDNLERRRNRLGERPLMLKWYG